MIDLAKLARPWTWSDAERPRDPVHEVAHRRGDRSHVGGAEIGHTRETMSAALTGQIWGLFSSLFATDRAYFTGLGLGDDKYVFQSGVAIVDATRAGFIGVVEND